MIYQSSKFNFCFVDHESSIGIYLRIYFFKEIEEHQYEVLYLPRVF